MHGIILHNYFMSSEKLIIIVRMRKEQIFLDNRHGLREYKISMLFVIFQIARGLGSLGTGSSIRVM